MDATTNEAYIKFCEIAKDIGVSDNTIDLIKKDLKMTDSDSAEEPTEEMKPEVKAVEVSVEKVDEKKTPMMEMLANMIKQK